MNNKAVIIGKDHHNALGVIESLGWKGLKPYIVILSPRNKSYLGHSKYVESGWTCGTEEDVIRILLENFTDPENKAVAYACDDDTAVILDKNHKLLEPFFFLLTTRPLGSLSMWTQKERMSSLAEEVGLTVPKTWISKGNHIPENVEYPIITKAQSSVEGGKDNIHVCCEREELEKVLQNSHCETLILQQFIDKEYEFQLIGCSLNGGEIVLIPGRTHIDRPNGMDNTFFLRFDKCEEEMEDIIEKATAFVRKTQYTGPFSIEFLKAKNGKKYFTEMNFRNDGNAICVAKSGTNIHYILYLFLTGGDYRKEIEASKVEKVYLVPEIYYFTCLLKREFGFKEWFRNMRKANCYTTWFKNDPLPFFYFLYWAMTKRLFKR